VDYYAEEENVDGGEGLGGEEVVVLVGYAGGDGGGDGVGEGLGRSRSLPRCTVFPQHLLSSLRDLQTSTFSSMQATLK